MNGGLEAEQGKETRLAWNGVSCDVFIVSSGEYLSP